MAQPPARTDFAGPRLRWKPVQRHIERSSHGSPRYIAPAATVPKRRLREALTDDLAAKPYESLEPDELDELVATLEPLATKLRAAQV